MNELVSWIAHIDPGAVAAVVVVYMFIRYLRRRDDVLQYTLESQTKALTELHIAIDKMALHLEVTNNHNGG